MSINYDKHNWAYGEEITPDKLNNVENGIKANADAINEVNNNLDFFKALEAQKSELILDRINASGSNFGCFGAADSSDTPDDGEWCVVWFGSYKRIIVIAVQYGTNNVNVCTRSIFDAKWIHSDWIWIHKSN